MKPIKIRSTTIVAVRLRGKAAIAGDGQLTYGEIILKHGGNKIRRLKEGNVLIGFAGAAADALALFEKLEGYIEAHPDDLRRASVELAKEWRTDKYLRNLEAVLAVVDKKCLLMISGTGEVIEPDDGILAIGSGAPEALGAARALVKYSKLTPKEIVTEALKIASSICIYTNDQITVEEL
ncbi:HslU--HslV peptidase proteolytic subunit [candidate division LCP-89 bacterium B3_LCP]|uniref:HslU--HslV peptidase proteolytic subunit n=1 Tax=candidate division LCP-89 bacterium B3_LCP TaxID=2012998 RepID=A0A532V1D1_UNCL8|nr:MAG: HslU--HslV peptidase proteolytic subunit [candidate division LCP-89 bacterium B3_LCP]